MKMGKNIITRLENVGLLHPKGSDARRTLFTAADILAMQKREIKVLKKELEAKND
jgi:hypothetical protein